MTLQELLGSKAVRRVEFEGRTFYTASDVVGVLGKSGSAQWERLKRDEPQLARLARKLVISQEEIEVLDLTGVLRLIQSIDGPRAARLKLWLAKTAFQRLCEAENPELAALRAGGSMSGMAIRRDGSTSAFAESAPAMSSPPSGTSAARATASSFAT